MLYDNSCGINITDTGITYMEPSGFGTTMTESFVPFDSIAAVSTVVPLVGFSSIIITLKGQGRIVGNNFRKKHVETMKGIILEKIQ
jgi:hypothetical protein